MKARFLTSKQVAEFRQKDFHGEDTWNAWKTEYDGYMAYRNSLKGKPTFEQRVALDAGMKNSEQLSRLLWRL